MAIKKIGQRTTATTWTPCFCLLLLFGLSGCKSPNIPGAFNEVVDQSTWRADWSNSQTTAQNKNLDRNTSVSEKSNIVGKSNSRSNLALMNNANSTPNSNLTMARPGFDYNSPNKQTSSSQSKPERSTGQQASAETKQPKPLVKLASHQSAPQHAVPIVSSDTQSNTGSRGSNKAGRYSPKNQQLTSEARTLEKGGNLQDAISLYEKAIQQNPKDSFALHRLAVLLDQSEQMDKSLPFYQRAIALDAQNSELLCDFGFRWHLIGNQSQAEKYYQQALNLDPSNQRAHNNLAVLLARSGRIHLAKSHFQYAGLSDEEAQQNLQISVSAPDLNSVFF